VPASRTGCHACTDRTYPLRKVRAAEPALCAARSPRRICRRRNNRIRAPVRVCPGPRPGRRPPAACRSRAPARTASPHKTYGKEAEYHQRVREILPRRHLRRAQRCFLGTRKQKEPAMRVALLMVRRAGMAMRHDQMRSCDALRSVLSDFRIRKGSRIAGMHVIQIRWSQTC